MSVAYPHHPPYLATVLNCGCSVFSADVDNSTTWSRHQSPKRSSAQRSASSKGLSQLRYGSLGDCPSAISVLRQMGLCCSPANKQRARKLFQLLHALTATATYQCGASRDFYRPKRQVLIIGELQRLACPISYGPLHVTLFSAGNRSCCQKGTSQADLPENQA